MVNYCISDMRKRRNEYLNYEIISFREVHQPDVNDVFYITLFKYHFCFSAYKPINKIIPYKSISSS